MNFFDRVAILAIVLLAFALILAIVQGRHECPPCTEQTDNDIKPTLFVHSSIDPEDDEGFGPYLVCPTNGKCTCVYNDVTYFEYDILCEGIKK